MHRKFDLSFVNTGAGNVAFLPVLDMYNWQVFQSQSHIPLDTVIKPSKTEDNYSAFMHV